MFCEIYDSSQKYFRFFMDVDCKDNNILIDINSITTKI
jgi:hypothetical protein